MARSHSLQNGSKTKKVVAARKPNPQAQDQWVKWCAEHTWTGMLYDEHFDPYADLRLIYKSEGDTAKRYYLLKDHELATLPRVEHRSPQEYKTQTYDHEDVKTLLRQKLAVLVGEMNAESDWNELLNKGEGLLSGFLQKRRKARKREVKTVPVAESERITAEVYHCPKPEGGGGPQETGNDTSADGLGRDDMSESVAESECLTAKVYHEGGGGPQETGNDTSLSADGLSLDDVSESVAESDERPCEEEPASGWSQECSQDSPWVVDMALARKRMRFQRPLESVAESERITAEVYLKPDEFADGLGLVDRRCEEEPASGWSQRGSQDSASAWVVDMAFAKERGQF
ncbi:hypothetical protein C8R46DRAFT_1343513 [Mycena filopes]|nr:hypothetical protein C8R46DRAFT_1343513 [Mycena filopes]